MATLPKLFTTILTGNKDQSRTATRHVRKLFYSPGQHTQYAFIASIINNAPKEYQKIAESFRQENFVTAISVLYFLHSAENSPNFLFPWLFHLLQHKNGVIRHAAIHMLESEINTLTYHIRFPNAQPGYPHAFAPEQADTILFELFVTLVELAEDFWKPSYKKIKYISSLPSSPYKSIQIILCILEEKCGTEYTARLEDSFRDMKIMEDKTRLISEMKESDIMEQTTFTLFQARLKQMRMELENQMLPAMLHNYPKFNFEKVVEQIYEGNLTIRELIILVDDSINLNIQSQQQRNAFLDFISTMWNLYPHKELDGHSPYEIAAMHEINQKE